MGVKEGGKFVWDHERSLFEFTKDECFCRVELQTAMAEVNRTFGERLMQKETLGFEIWLVFAVKH